MVDMVRRSLCVRGASRSSQVNTLALVMDSVLIVCIAYSWKQKEILA